MNENGIEVEKNLWTTDMSRKECLRSTVRLEWSNPVIGELSRVIEEKSGG